MNAEKICGMCNDKPVTEEDGRCATCARLVQEMRRRLRQLAGK